MKTATFTKEEKAAYFKQLREHWQETKSLLDEKKIDEIDAIIREHGLNISRTGFLFVSIQMRQQGLDGLPYVDCKTFKGWRDSGFTVRKGEKSTISGITWIQAGESDETESPDEQDLSGYCFPKQYHLFHRSQVAELS